MDAGAGNHPGMDAAATRARREAEPRPPEVSYQSATPSPRVAAGGLGPSCLGLQVASCTFTHCRTAPPQPTLGAQLPLMHPGCEGDGSVGAHRCQAVPGWGQETAPASGPLSGLGSQPPASPPPAPTAARGTPHPLDITCPTSPGLQLWGRPSSDSGADLDVAREPMPHPVLPLS